MVDAPVVDKSKHQEHSWHNLACILSLNYSQKAGSTKKSGEHSVTAAIKSAQGVYNLYNHNIVSNQIAVPLTIGLENIKHFIITHGIVIIN